MSLPKHLRKRTMFRNCDRRLPAPLAENKSALLGLLVQIFYLFDHFVCFHKIPISVYTPSATETPRV